MNDNRNLDQIEELKNKARIHNISGNLDSLSKVLVQLDELLEPKEIVEFHNELEKRPIAKGD